MTSLSPAPGVHDQSETPPARAQQNQKGHTRTYQACIPCRNRKVRCDLGAVDNPHPPPCARCARESKECFFSATRRKRKTNDGYDESEVGDVDYESRNGRKKSLRLASVENEPPSVNSGFAVPPTQITPTNSYASLDGRPRTPGGSLGRTEPLRRPSGLQRLGDEATDQKLTSATTAILQTGEIFSGHDALNLLYEAAGRNGDIENHHSSSSNAVSQTAGKHGPTQSQNSFASPAAGTYRPSRGIPPVDTAYHQPASASVSQSQSNGASSSDAKLEVATKVWSKLRFVRAGWFTAKEGMAYLEHFYKFLSPLTPVVVPDYRDPGSHASLLRDESLLAVTLLTIASRHMQLEGPGGSSRAYEIHGMLWKYLQGMINRLIWGQEQFGGGFCGAGAQSGSEVDPFSRKGLRTLGTIESLLLITEWHPRALHFPPNDDGDELVPSDDTVFHTVNSPGMYKGVGGQRMDAWLEPCWRSDRICWMLLGNAMTLAYEIGVFDERSDDEYQQASPNVSAEQIHKYVRRKNHIRELLVVYSTQTSGRLGLTSMMPKMEGGRAILQAPALQLFAQSPGIRSPSITRMDLRSPNVGQSPMTPIQQQSPQDVQDIVIHHWIEIAKLGELGNKLLFLNRNQTRDLIRSGKYAQLLDAFKPRMEAWRREFDSCTTMPHIMRHILTIEYEYSRVYINSLALQAVVVRCAANSPVDTDADIDPRNRGENGAIPFSTLSNWLYNDRKYVEEVIAASRTVLEIVVKHLYPVYLRHAPVRTFFRIVSVAIILLKTFALGATEQDVAISLGLLDQTAHVLSLSIVDDVHVGNRFAELLRTLTARIRSRFVRMAPAGGSSNNASRATSRSPLVAHAPIPGSNQNPYPNPSESSTPHMPPPQQPQNVAHMHTNHAAWPTYGGVQYFSGPSTPGFAGPLSGRATPMMTGFGPSGFPAMPSDPLQGISTEAFDPVSRGVNIMPPPNFDEIINGGYHGNTQGGMNGGPYNGNGEANSHGGNGGTGDGESSGPMPDWLALPLDNLLNYGADVTETTIGPTVGGIDLLDVLLSSMEGTA